MKKPLRATLLCAAFLLSSHAPTQLMAQSQGTAVSQIVTIDRQQLFSATAYGRRVVSTVEQERKRLADETREVEAQLVEEERTLTEQRSELSAEAFRILATAFDEKVSALRQEGIEREQVFVQSLEREQAEFFARIGPILGQLLREIGAVVILDQRAILLTTQNIDITEQAIERINAVLGDGADTTPEDAPSETAPQTDPTADGATPPN